MAAARQDFPALTEAALRGSALLLFGSVACSGLAWEGIFGAATIYEGNLVILIEGACLDGLGGVDCGQERALGDERVANRHFKELAQEMALCDAMIGLGKALAHLFVLLRRRVSPPKTALGWGLGL